MLCVSSRVPPVPCLPSLWDPLLLERESRLILKLPTSGKRVRLKVSQQMSFTAELNYQQVP